MPVEYVDAFFDVYADGTLDESQVLPTVQGVTGHRPAPSSSGRGHTPTPSDSVDPILT